ncbi:MAG: hypothetical protein QM750_00105 [Rubrivivax sp.]
MKVTFEMKGLEAAQRALQQLSDVRIARAGATALTRTARDIEKAWTSRLESAFDRPTPATTRATVVKMARQDDLTAEVFIRDRSSGTPPAEWLAPEEYGGQRRLKKFEQALIAQGSMPPGMHLFPAPDAPRDAYGNVSRSTIIQVIAQLGAQYSPGYQRVISASAAKRVAKALSSGRKFIAIPRPQGRLAAGVYLRKGRELEAVFYFVRMATYRPRADLHRAAQDTAARVLQGHLVRALNESLARQQTT